MHSLCLLALPSSTFIESFRIIACLSVQKMSDYLSNTDLLSWNLNLYNTKQEHMFSGRGPFEGKYLSIFSENDIFPDGPTVEGFDTIECLINFVQYEMYRNLLEMRFMPFVEEHQRFWKKMQLATIRIDRSIVKVIHNHGYNPNGNSHRDFRIYKAKKSLASFYECLEMTKLPEKGVSMSDHLHGLLEAFQDDAASFDDYTFKAQPRHSLIHRGCGRGCQLHLPLIMSTLFWTMSKEEIRSMIEKDDEHSRSICTIGFTVSTGQLLVRNDPWLRQRWVFWCASGHTSCPLVYKVGKERTFKEQHDKYYFGGSPEDNYTHLRLVPKKDMLEIFHEITGEK